MSHIVRVGKEIEFVNDAEHAANISGSMLEKRVHFSDNFTQEAINADVWTSTVDGSGDSIAISETAGGSLLFTTGTVDNDASHLGGAIIWNAVTESVLEARVTIDDVSQSAVFVGFSDAKSESAALLAIGYQGDTLTTTATDVVGFIIDADSSTIAASTAILAGSKNGTDATPVSSGIVWADGETKDLRIELNADGSANGYIDGVGVGYIADAVTAATLMCATVQVQTRAAGSGETIRLHRIDVWANQT
jgi:hypothetical protein